LTVLGKEVGEKDSVTEIGIMSLSLAKSKQGDNLLTHYRTLPSNVWCTTVVKVRCTLQEKGRDIINEAYTDRTGSLGTKKDALPLWSIMATLREATKKQEQPNRRMDTDKK